MFKRIRNSYFTKGLAVYIAFNMLGQVAFPTISMALTPGPVDVNLTGFEPASTSEMVNLTTGDFTYNIPLLDVDGYPINIAYHGGIGMDQEASSVGLGWSLNVGAINRIKRGLPDDFNGDEVKTTMKMRPQLSMGGSIGGSWEVIGFDGEIFDVGLNANLGIGINYSNYVGLSTEVFGGLSVQANAGVISGSLGVQVNSNSQNGMSITPNAKVHLGKEDGGPQLGIGIGYTYNSLSGVTNKSLSLSLGGIPRIPTSSFPLSAVVPVSAVSYTPSVQFETASISANFDFSLGLEACLNSLSGQFKAYKSQTCLKKSVETIPAYGFMFEEEHVGEPEYLLDFNQEGVVQTNRFIANLPVTNHTYDLYSATAQGLGFTFRSHRSEVGIVSEMSRENTINGVGVSAEISGLDLFQGGINVDIPSGNVSSGKWTQGNHAEPNMNFKSTAPGGTDSKKYEKTYFKKFGNRSTIDGSFYSNMGEDEAIEQKLLKAGPMHFGQVGFVDADGNIEFSSNNNNHYKSERDLRNTNIQYLNAEQADQYALQTNVENYNLSDYAYLGGSYTSGTVSRYGSLSSEAKEHHLSEMTVLKGDGSRYVYGIPVINTKTEEVTFNVSDESSNDAGILTKDCQAGKVSYGANDNSLNNTRGVTNLYLKREIPAYASSYLLTAYLSSNYIDRTEDGPTPDDFGGYTKFNYAKSSTQNKWRFPFESNEAYFNEGMKSDIYDDMGSYVYGERDQWHLHSIETKNFVAEFHYGERDDAFGVDGENGGIAGANNAKRLEKIELYTRKGKVNGEAPIKTVHFEYDYSLCQNVPNNNSSVSGQKGKLTLTGIYFTYGDSPRGKLHKYTFDYASGNQNPDYTEGSQDRWGVYKPVPGGAGCAYDDSLTNMEYPYTDQDTGNTNAYAGAWMLKTIHLPSGSDISVEVESDDYSYVQDERADRMFMIRGFSESSTFVSGGEEEELYDSPGGDHTPHNYLHVEVGDLGDNASDAKNNFFSNYLKPHEELYFKILVKLPSTVPPIYPVGSKASDYDYVSGYAEIDVGATEVYDQGSDGTYETVAIKLKGVCIEDDCKNPANLGTNPVAKASWQFIRKYATHILNPVLGDIYKYDGEAECGVIADVPQYEEDDELEADQEVEDEGNFFQNIINTGASHIQNLESLGGLNNMMAAFHYAAKCKPGKSWVRLGTGTDPKLGGGHRVKKIEVTDNWNNVSSEATSTYGTAYTYTTEAEFGDHPTISSGVASYEPIHSGGDENAMRSPIDYDIDVKMRVNDEEFQELPFGESIFANPTVAYSKITVNNISYTDVTQNATGTTVYENYTAKDFPVIFDHTGFASGDAIESTNDWTALFTMEAFSHLTMSQGFSLHLNDMHGKFKSKTVYGQAYGTNPPKVYFMEHEYYTDNSNHKKLDNLMTVVDEEGVISSKYMGRDLDMVMNLVETSSLYSTTTVGAGIDASLCVFSFPVPSVWYSNFSQENRFRSSTTTKVVTSNGILKEVRLNDKGRYKISRNLIFDQTTGVPVVTEIQHEAPGLNNPSYEVPIYQYDYPAYWKYAGMGAASANWGSTFDGIVSSSCAIILANKENYLEPGDELAVYNTSTGAYLEKVWVVENESTGEYFIAAQNGDNPAFTPGSSHQYRVIRSGKRNLLGSTMASVTSTTKNTTNPYTTAPTDVINASAVEYTEDAFGYVSTKSAVDKDNYCGLYTGDIVNPYVRGLRGNWNLLASYVYDYTRNQSTGNSRIDGVLTAYTQFWQYNNTSGEWEKNSGTNFDERWIQSALATLFDREGYNLESKDALGIYSSILLGYNKTLKIGEAVNSRYYEIGFDGFEDHTYDQSADCTEPHFRFWDENERYAVPLEGEAHTGRYSLRMQAAETYLHISDVVNSVDHSTTNHSKPYTIQSQEMISGHTLISSETDTSKYVLTLWAKETGGNGNVTNYDGVQVDLTYDGNTITDRIEKRTNIINGWQRIEISFALPPETIVGSKEFKITLKNKGNEFVYFDDVRIQPFNSEMVTYVIDPVTLRLWATLDSRNFATFYQYDEEGSLVRIIQETERGRVTVQENRAGIQIQ
ncbi:MAG: hypothetical protein WDZ35_11240 [Crocinitomicaceae bacterium]